MKLAKRILIILLALIVVGGVASFFYFKNKFMGAPPNQLIVSNVGQPMEFIWRGEEINGRIEPHSAMFVPVRIPSVDRTFYMQFDLGAHSTVLYYNKILSINEKYGPVFQLDTIDNKVKASDVALQVGTVEVTASEMSFRGRSTEIDWSDSTSMIKIGTVGADFIEQHALIMDFQNQQLTLTEQVPQGFESTSAFLPFTFDGRKLFLSAHLNDESASLWYGSGSSAFELIVEESTFLELATPGAKRETYIANSWGTGVKIHNIESEGTFQFGSVSVPLTYVTYIEWPNKLQALIMKAANIGGDLGGMTGNKLFLGKTLILDTPNLRYSVIDQNNIGQQFQPIDE